ncbi:hypothetical protein [Flavobacterium sp. IMCC34518]|uniref:hypothetical protein n=1 Tax=Flavobacterium sp. IMCC34518 TaxID=3003623 RepID=UPI0022ABF180|nr:hypothetical protein [Flavobacterium sp. IMCC34518]
MPIKSKVPKPTEKAESIFQTEARLKKEALEISKNFKHTKPVILLAANGTKRQLN